MLSESNDYGMLCLAMLSLGVSESNGYDMLLLPLGC
jgi:hypothetical protein